NLPIRKHMSYPAVLSVTNPQMVLSVEFANNITNSIGGNFDPDYGYVGPCNSTIEILIGLAENTISLGVNTFDSMYTIPIPNSTTTCYAGFTDTN
ncbi:29463_t:CDS:2, partial [Racocetra persica]